MHLSGDYLLVIYVFSAEQKSENPLYRVVVCESVLFCPADTSLRYLLLAGWKTTSGRLPDSV